MHDSQKTKLVGRTSKKFGKQRLSQISIEIDNILDNKVNTQ